MNRFVVCSLLCSIVFLAVACSWLSDLAPELAAEPEAVTAPSSTSVDPDSASQGVTGEASPSEGDPNATAEDAPAADSDKQPVTTPVEDPAGTMPTTLVEDPGADCQPANDTTTFCQPLPAVCAVRGDWPTYVVAAGDTLSQIARRANTTVDELMTANCLADPDRLYSGQILHVPQAIEADPLLTPIPHPWIRYYSALYQVSFNHPANWRDTSHGLMTKVSGDDGFVRLAASGSPHDLNKVTEDQAYHELQPYGHTPVIEALHLRDGREARLIFPSDGQLETLRGEALLVTSYAEPIPVGNYRHNYLMLSADVEHIRQIAQSLELPPPTAQIGIKNFDVSVEELSSGGKRLSFAWDSFGATRGLIVSGTAERFAPWWPVEASGELTVDLSGTIFENPAMTLRVFNDITGEEISETIRVNWPCTHDYFFSPGPERCPRDAPLVTTGAFQPFERGFMIWLPQPGSAHPSIYVFQDTGQVLLYSDTWTDAEPEYDPALIPPEGLYQPVRGFGKVWREVPGLMDKLGWATLPESAYQVTYQGEARESIPGVVYLTHPDGRILQLIDLEWHVFTPG